MKCERLDIKGRTLRVSDIRINSAELADMMLPSEFDITINYVGDHDRVGQAIVLDNVIIPLIVEALNIEGTA